MSKQKHKKYNYIYKTTNILNNKFYIGMHVTNDLDDGYIGSGTGLKHSIKKHGIENHKCEILEHLSDREALRKREAEIVNSKLLAEPMCMNIALGGIGGWEHVNASLTKEQKTKRSKAGWLAAGGIEFNRKNQREFQERLKSDPEYYDWWYSTLVMPPDWTGKKHTEKTKQLLREVHKGLHEGEKNSQFGTRWVCNQETGDVKKIHKSKLEEYLNNGWVCGRKQL